MRVCRSLGDIGRENAGDAGSGERGVGLGDGVRKVDGPSGVFNDDGFEAEVVAVDGGVADAEVIGEAAEEETFEAALTEIAGEPRGGAVVVFEEGGVAVDVAAEAFAEDEFGVGDVQVWVEGCAFGVLDGVLGPEGLRAVRGLVELVVWLVVGGREGDVSGGVPVLRKDDVSEFFGESVDDGNDLVAVRYCQVAAGHEVVLNVNDEECVARLELHGHLMVEQAGRIAVELCTRPASARRGALELQICSGDAFHLFVRLATLWKVPILISDFAQPLSRQKLVIQTSPSPSMAPCELTKRASYFCFRMASEMSSVMMRS
jgi:hypothetical protein